MPKRRTTEPINQFADLRNTQDALETLNGTVKVDDCYNVDFLNGLGHEEPVSPLLTEDRAYF